MAGDILGGCIVGRTLRAVLLTADARLANLADTLWPRETVEWKVYEQGGKAVEMLLTDPPDLLVVDDAITDMSALDVVAMIKAENVYRQLPVAVCLSRVSMQAGVDWSRVEADEFLLRPDTENGWDPDVVRTRLELTLCRAARTMDTNPLSKLPGNTTIIQRIQDLIDRKAEFALAYCDLDNFKAFNDKYGFSRGDEALMMSARVIVNTIRSLRTDLSFVGHVGGDDFVFIVPLDKAEEACRQVIATFDSIVPNFYDADDRKRGTIRSTDRQGNVVDFPFMGVSIAVVMNWDGKLSHFGEVSHIASGLKKKAKQIPESSYVLDQRKK